VTDKAQSYAKVSAEINLRFGPENAIRQVTRKYLNNRIESDHAALKCLTGPRKGFRRLASAKATIAGIGAMRTIKKPQTLNAETGLVAEGSCVQSLFGITV
jgi:transposase, IS6 family